MEEGVEVGRRVRLPRGAEPPIRVYVNGVRQSEGEDYRVRGGEIVFSRPIVKEGKVGGLRWLAMLLGLFGTYRKHEVVDVEYRLGGRLKLASDVEDLPTGLTRDRLGGEAEQVGDTPAVHARRCPSAAGRHLARLSRKWRSCSHVNPIPPRTWSAVADTPRRVRGPRLAIAAASGSDSGSASAAHAA